MELQEGWYKVKINGKWVCAYYDECCFAILMPNHRRVWCDAEELDQIGDRIEFPND